MHYVTHIDDEYTNILYENYLTDKDQQKLNLRDSDNKTLTKIINSITSDKPLEFTDDDSVSMINAYELLQRKITKRNYETIIKGLSKLTFISIGLDKEDEPQIIFETLNSTGRDLTTSDLVRNYILMDSTDQEKLYTQYWQHIEEGFRDDSKNGFDEFIYNYLMIKLGKNVYKSKAYKTFKSYKIRNYNNNIEELMQDLNKYANYYFNIVYEQEKDPQLQKTFEIYNKLLNTTPNRFLLPVYKDYEEAQNDPNINLTKEDLIEIVETIESYIFRRILTERISAMAATFLNLHKNIDKKNYLNSFKANLLKYPTNNSKSFPTDIEFEEAIKKGNLENLPSKYTEYFETKINLTKEDYMNPEILVQKMKQTWPYPQKTQEIQQIISTLKTDDNEVTIDYYEQLHPGTQTRKLYDELLTMLTNNTTDEIEQHFYKTIITFKTNDKILLRIEPQKQALKIYLDININKINDPKGLCKDLSQNHTRTDTKLYIKDTNDILPAYEIIKQTQKIKGGKK